MKFYICGFLTLSCISCHNKEMLPLSTTSNIPTTRDISDAPCRLVSAPRDKDIVCKSQDLHTRRAASRSDMKKLFNLFFGEFKSGPGVKHRRRRLRFGWCIMSSCVRGCKRCQNAHIFNPNLE